MGVTTKTMAELQTYLHSINHQFTAATYNLLTNNCNNFSDACVNFLVNHGIPSYIIDLPNIVFSTPMGAMLRPMIENMQNQINASGGGMDPFGGGLQAANFPSQQRMQTTQTQQDRNARTQAFTSSTHSAPMRIVQAQLEELPLLSAENNRATLDAITNKLINTKKSDGSGELLDEATKNVILNVKNNLNANSSAIHNVEISKDEVDSILLVINQHLPCQMSALFLLRLAVLSSSICHSVPSIIDMLVEKLILGVAAFSGIPACVMALCTLSNLFGNDKAKILIFEHRLENRMIDSAMSYLGHERTELRQISATFIYNFTLSCTNSKAHSQAGWCPPGTATVTAVDGVTLPQNEEEIPELAVQILCSTLEGVSNEVDGGVRKRRLCSSLRVVRRCKSAAINLINDLGFKTYFDEILAMPSLPEDERIVASELARAVSI